MSSTNSNPLRIGVMLENVQLSDITCIDIFGNLSKEYVDMLTPFGYAQYQHLSMPMKFYYISSSMESSEMTPSLQFLPNTTYATCPRDLDILLIGGPPLDHRPEEAKTFMQEAFRETKVVMTTCIGAIWLASAGVLGGKTCTTNREFLAVAKTLHPEVNWVDQRWVVDGKLWTAGGAGAGIDMVAEYALQTWDKEFVTALALRLLEFERKARGQFYKD